MKHQDLDTKRPIDQPRIVLHLLVAVVFFGALLEFDMPQPTDKPVFDLACPIIQSKATDESGEYSVPAQRCFWFKTPKT